MMMCDQWELDKYDVEALLTTLFMNNMENSCGSVDNATAPAGIGGFCDMSPERTVIQNDNDELVPVHKTGGLPCRFYTREGVRIKSISLLASAMEKAKESSSDGTDPELHLYAVPAGRPFHFAPSYIGEKFVLDHMSKDLGEPVIIEVLSLKPRIFELYNFFSDEEGQALIKTALTETRYVYLL